MGLLRKLFGAWRPSQDAIDRSRAAVMEDPFMFFYVREWGCKPNATVHEVAHALGLTVSRELALAEGLDATETSASSALLVPYDAAVFVFCKGIGFSDLHVRLSATGGAAYTIFLDDKRTNYLCSLAVDGKDVRQLAFADGQLSVDGIPAADEPPLDDESLDLEIVLAIASSWGPDPVAMIRTATVGSLCVES